MPKTLFGWNGAGAKGVRKELSSTALRFLTSPFWYCMQYMSGTLLDNFRPRSENLSAKQSTTND